MGTSFETASDYGIDWIFVWVSAVFEALATALGCLGRLTPNPA